MTADELVGRVENYRLFREEHIPFNPGEVFPAATFAQTELCNELLLLESTANLILVANQERYQFPPVTITGATNTTPIVVTAPNHKLNTGDTGIIAGVLGAVGANGKWPTITKVDANSFSLDASLASGAYAGGGKLYHGLYAAISLKYLRKTANPFGDITWKAKEDIETDRNQVAGSATANQGSVPGSNVVSFYEIYDEPLIVGFQAIPGATLATEAFFYRRPLPSEAISATVDPIVPYQYDKALFLGTLYEVLTISIRKEVQDHAKEVRELYKEEKERVKGVLKRQRLPKYVAAATMRIR